MRVARHLFLFAAIAIVIAGCARGPRVTIVAPDGRRRAAVSVEVAGTPAKREVGLMYRKQLGASAGMIFIFRTPAHQEFWMRNTEIPLDMIFADSNRRVIGVVANAAPHTDTPRAVDGDSQYVLEVNGGFAAAHAIHAGDRLRFSGFSPTTGR
ncbi:MAG: DUF192 domain-containing protein [Candidatus Binataceae bacterium]